MATNNLYTLEELFARDFGASSESVRMENIQKTISQVLADTSKDLNDMMSDFAETSEDVQRMWGAFLDGEAVEAFDEYMQAGTSVPKDGQLIQFPLRRILKKTGFTNLWLRMASPTDMAKRMADLTFAFNQRAIAEIKFALFNKTRADFKDYLTNNVTLTKVQPFVNADSEVIPNAIGSGEAFTASSHQHYVGTAGAALAAADITTLLENVSEHGLTGLVLRINASNVSTLENLASTKFTAISHTSIVKGAGYTVASDDPANDDVNHKLVGFWNGIPVETRIYVPADYYMALAQGAGEKPLVKRVNSKLGSGSIISEQAYGNNVLTAEQFAMYYGLSAWNRVGCAFLKGNVQTTYANPSGLVR